MELGRALGLAGLGALRLARLGAVGLRRALPAGAAFICHSESLLIGSGDAPARRMEGGIGIGPGGARTFSAGEEPISRPPHSMTQKRRESPAGRPGETTGLGSGAADLRSAASEPVSVTGTNLVR